VPNRHRSCSGSIESQQSTQRSLVPRRDFSKGVRGSSRYSGASSSAKKKNHNHLQISEGTSTRLALRNQINTAYKNMKRNLTQEDNKAQVRQLF